MVSEVELAVTAEIGPRRTQFGNKQKEIAAGAQLELLHLAKQLVSASGASTEVISIPRGPLAPKGALAIKQQTAKVIISINRNPGKK